MSAIAPTKTLAALYEAQHHYEDALLIYHHLQKEEFDESIQIKIIQLSKKLDLVNNRNPLITSIFTEEECSFFQIYPEKLYKKLQQTSFNSASCTEKDSYKTKQEMQDILSALDLVSKEDFKKMIHTSIEQGNSLENITLQDLFQSFQKDYEKK